MEVHRDQRAIRALSAFKDHLSGLVHCLIHLLEGYKVFMK